MPKAGSSKPFALVTGASRGLGLEISALLIKAGYSVTGVSRTDEHWKAARKKIASANFKLVEADISDESSVAELFARLDSKKIDLLVNSAAYGGLLQKIEDTSAAEFEKHLRSNVLALFLICRAALPYLKKAKNPLVLNLSSMAGVRAVPKIAGYSASKFGVLAITEALAKENPDWLRAITVCPGGMNTKMRSDLFGKEDASKQQSPLFVAEKMMQIVKGEIPLLSPSHIVIRHGKITQIIIPPNN